MANPGKYKELFDPLNGKPSGSKPGQMIACCPHHDHQDNNPSFSYNISDDMGGAFSCQACGWYGGGYDYAKYFGLENPKQYYNNYKGKGGNLFVQESAPPRSDVEREMAAAVEVVENCPDLIPPIWERKWVKKVGMGFMENLWWYPRKINGRVYGYKKGKHYQTPGVKCGVFPSIDIINEFDFNKPLIICEGEPDCVTALSDGKQAICFTAGANSIPRGKDGKYALKWLTKFKIIIIVYDNDPPGEAGAVKLKNEIAKIHNGGEVRIAKWNKDCGKGYDISESFMEGSGLYFYDALDNAEVFTISASGTKSAERQEHDNDNKYEGFETMTLNKFIEAEFEPQYPLIENIMDKGTITLIAGDEGTGKSWVILSISLSLASGVQLFDFFEIHSSEDYD